jgi:hypothetical protein
MRERAETMSFATHKEKVKLRDAVKVIGNAGAERQKLVALRGSRLFPRRSFRGLKTRMRKIHSRSGPEFA